MRKQSLNVILFVLMSGVLIFLTFNRHSKSGYYNYHSELWADKAGYYVYLPASLKYNFKANDFPDSIDMKVGYGFKLDLEENKVLTKYTYGVAFLQSFFYLLADSLSTSVNQKADGFSPIYHWSINVAAIFYLISGIFFLYRFLKAHFKKKAVILTLITIVLGTNLYYYSIDETGMSHVYSFALFSVFLFLIDHSSANSIIRILLISFIGGLIVLIRPTNILFIIFSLSLYIITVKDLTEKAKHFLTLKRILAIVIPVIIIFLPQFLYWHYLHGSYFVDPYSDEGFNFFSPKIAITLFSPKNGLFLYTPIALIMIIAVISLILTKKYFHTGIKIGLLFILLTYILSCWWRPGFGCSFGARSYVEYYAILSIPLAYLYEQIFNKSKFRQIIFWTVILLFVVYNLKMTYTYDECFYGNYWDWKEYQNLLFSPTK